MRIGRYFLVAALALSLSALPGCGVSQVDSSTESESETSASQKNELTDDFDFQGVSIKVDPSWRVVSPSEDDDLSATIVIDSSNTRITIQTVLHGQTSTLEGAWGEFTNWDSSSDPAVHETDSWSEDGIDYITGTYRDSYYLLAGTDKATGKGFLLWLTVNTDSWDKDDAERLFNALTNSVSYDPTETTIDYKEEWAANNGTSSDPEETSEQAETEEEASTPTVYTAGTYKVGTDIPAGEYKLTSTDSLGGYWEVTGSSAPDADIIGNDNFTGTAYVTVSDGQYLKIDGCTASPTQ